MRQWVRYFVMALLVATVSLPLASCKKEGYTPAEKVFLYATRHVNEQFFLSLEDYSEITGGYAVRYTAAMLKTGSTGLNQVVDHAMKNGMAIWGQCSKNVYYYSSIRIFDNYGEAIYFALAQGQSQMYNINTGEIVDCK